MRATQYSFSGFGSIERVVGDAATSGRIHVPKTWIGKRAIVILLEPITDPSVPLPPSSE
jgi:hypothetical protein